MFTKYNATVTYAPFGFEGIVLSGVVGRTRKDAIECVMNVFRGFCESRGMAKWEADANAKMAKFKLSKVKATN